MGNLCSQGIGGIETYADEKQKNYVRRFSDYWSKKDYLFDEQTIVTLRASFPNELEQQTRFGQQILLGIVRREPEFLKLYKKMGTNPDPAVLQNNSAFIAQAQRYVSTFKMAVFMAEKETFIENQLMAIGKRHREHLPADLPMHFWHSFYSAVLEVIVEKVNENDSLDANEKLIFAKSWENLIDYVVSVVAWAFYCLEPNPQSSRLEPVKKTQKACQPTAGKAEKKPTADNESKKPSDRHSSPENKKPEPKQHKEERREKAIRGH
ncbi:Globin domain containing protein [Trichuris trichiura]|uniref:Globin domain containing protein n=1 Tax=Trichuris trichiura TaxID=36087 RepID=A0A077YUP1_TRITR|nr:Globin domain containing protein [Trichuris trichiura]